MQKIFIFMLLCCCCIGTKAQDCLADNTATTYSVDIYQKFDGKLFKSDLYKSQIVMTLESDYDVIYRDVPPHSIIASRGGKYYMVEIFTGVETEIIKENVYSGNDDTDDRYEHNRKRFDDDDEE